MKKCLFELKVLETQALLPSQIAKAIPKPFTYREMTATAIVGTFSKSGDEYFFTARGSHQKFALKVGDVLKQRINGIKSMVAVTGKLEELPGKDGQKPLPVIDLTEVREISGEGTR